MSEITRETTAPPTIFKILHRSTGAIVHEVAAESLRAAVISLVAQKANLGGANLGGANLGGANLGDANLGGAKKLIGDRPAFTLGPIGSRRDYFSAYLTDKGIYLRAGCFFGTVAEFVDKLEREHGTSEHGQEYRAALTLIECHARLWTPDASASQAEATAEAVEA